MNLKYKPKTDLEKFGEKVFNLLVENFSQTFYVGGVVRDFLLGKKITDIDIATSAKPFEIAKILKKNSIPLDQSNSRFGVISAIEGKYKIEIATFRKDLESTSRYPNVKFVKTAKQDSSRRDFTVNALYLSPKSLKVLDYHNGLKDLKLRQLKFIGNPALRIKQDPLRIVRALRFAKTLNLKLEKQTAIAIEKNIHLLKTLTPSRIEKEIKKIKNSSHKKLVSNALKI
jgi:tRNA nucleotidyltransferase/poly(A) polymerase